MLNKNSSDLGLEIVDFQFDVQFKTKISQRGFWILVDEVTYPPLKETFQRLTLTLKSRSLIFEKYQLIFAKMIFH